MIKFSKRFAILLLAPFLFSCANISDYNVSLDKKLDEVAVGASLRPYYNHHYYYYNLEGDVGRLEQTYLSSIFSYDGRKFIMNLDVNKALGLNSETDLINSSDIIYEKDDYYIDYSGDNLEYQVRIYDFQDFLLLEFNTNEMDFYAFSTNRLSLNDIAVKMLKIAKSINLDLAKINSDFSKDEVISYHREQLDLFQNIVPQEGIIDDLFNNGEINQDNDDNDNLDGIDGDYVD